MKSLTAEELKALKVHDWVWVIYHKQLGDEEFYSCLLRDGSFTIPNFIDGISYLDLDYTTYGIKWLAYKNKEQAECKGRDCRVAV